MRLIDADKLNFSEQHYNKSQMKAILDFIDAQPTAYDVDKVVGQLRKQQEKLETDIFAKESDNWHGQYCNGIHEGIDKAIEIIKAGGL